MPDVSGTVDVILEFVDLAIARRRRSLSVEDRGRIESLEQRLRDVIDGARLAPRKIEGRAVDSGPSGAAAPAKSNGAPDAKGGQSISDLVDKLELSPTDKSKLKREVKLESLPKSKYTPAKAPTFLDDYYSGDIVLTGDIAWAAAPKAVKRADGEREVDLSKEARVLLGLEKPEPPKPEPQAARTGLPAAGAAAREPAQAPRGRPAIVHMLGGGVLRGQIDLFDPASGSIELLQEQSTGEDMPLAVDQVLAVFFGLFRGEEPKIPANAQRVAVRLVNDRQVAGLTEDYQEGGDALTVAPEQKRGNVHRIWIPAWAVKEIQLV